MIKGRHNFYPHFLLAFFVGLILSTPSVSQTVVTKNFKFQDGIYASFVNFQKNKPNFKWEEVETSLATNPSSLMTYIEFMRLKPTLEPIELDSIWGVVIEGIPFIRLNNADKIRNFSVFSGLVLRGRYCYFQFDTLTEKKVPITAYVPETGQPFVTKDVTQKQRIILEKLLDFETGSIYDFTLPNFKSLIEKRC
ncbi:MAG: hypothetical protein HC817_08390 [Saprospiraceae bacterium]|nr:hypothetical protein [Saprospiraceae bacterium]